MMRRKKRRRRRCSPGDGGVEGGEGVEGEGLLLQARPGTAPVLPHLHRRLEGSAGSNTALKGNPRHLPTPS